VGKHAGEQDGAEQDLQARADEFDAAQAATDARVAENQTNYPALQAYENNKKN
jgi:hypothetical protein